MISSKEALGWLVSWHTTNLAVSSSRPAVRQGLC
jgi:hypothetical protein